MSDTGARDKENGGLTAAEYVLGVLDADARRAAERRIARDMVFAREVGLGSAATTEEPHGMVLTYHVVPGRITANDLMEMVKKAGGKAMLKTVEGEELTVEMKDWRHLDLGCQRRRRQDHHQERDAVERRDPRHRHRAAAELTLPRVSSAPAKPAARVAAGLFLRSSAQPRGGAFNTSIFAAAPRRGRSSPSASHRSSSRACRG
jgi:hypothetical protein